MSESGPLRKWLKDREPLLPRPRVLESPVTYPVNSEIEKMREAKRIEWTRKGYPPGLINKALSLADGWVESMARAFTPPGRPDVREAIIRGSYEKALSVADSWISTMHRSPQPL